MGSQLRMRVFLTVLFCGAALALPNGRTLRPEEHWRPAAARDLSKFTPRHALVPAKSSPAENEFVQLARAIRDSRQSKSSHKASNVDLQATCGIEGPPSKDRIVGGFEAQENQWPWQVALFIDDAWFCGGSIISENYVLTAAHCADGAGYFDVMAEPKEPEQAKYLRSLAEIESEILGVKTWWIGLTDQGHEGRWFWEHSVSEAAFTDW